MSINTPIRDLSDLMNRIMLASRAVTKNSADAMAQAIDHALQTEQTDPIGDLSVNEVVDLVNRVAEENVPGGTKPAPVDTREMADAIEEDLIERTANALSVKSGKAPDEVKATVRAGLRGGGAGAFDTQHISASIGKIVAVAQGQDSSLPNLDDQTTNRIISDVVDDVRLQTAVTLANEMVTPQARIDGGYPLPNSPKR